MKIQICVGSSCHLKGAPEIVRLLTEAIQKYELEADVMLAGCFCMGKCNRDGVTVKIDDTVHPGITAGNFKEFFDDHILRIIQNERE